MLIAEIWKSLDFYNCQYLLTIGNSAFYYCEKFINVIMNDNIINIGDSSFSNSNNLKKLRISRKLNNIPISAFDSTSNLKSVVIPYGVTSINNNAFYNSGLEFVNIPYSVSNIGNCAFWHFNGTTLIFLDRGVINPIVFGEHILGERYYTNSNLNVYILGTYYRGNSDTYLKWSFDRYNIPIFVENEDTYWAVNDYGMIRKLQYLVIMDNKNPPLPKINNVDQFVKYVQENVNNLNDIKDIFYDSNYVYNLANEFNMLFNNSWIKSFELSGDWNNNQIISLNFNIYLYSGMMFRTINVPLLTPIYYPENYHNIIDNSGNVILNENIEAELKTIIVNFFAQYANTKNNSDLAIILGGIENLNTIYSLLNDSLAKYTNNYFEFNIIGFNVWNDGNVWSNGPNGYKTVDIAFQFNTNRIFLLNQMILMLLVVIEIILIELYLMIFQQMFRINIIFIFIIFYIKF